MENFSNPILVTGASGFLGSQLLETLKQMNLPAIGISRRNLPNLTQVSLEDPESIILFLKEVQPSAIIHCAGQPSSQIAWKEPLVTWQSNALVSLSLLEAVRACNTIPVVMVGTMLESTLNEVYEKDDVRDHELYAASKYAQTLLTIIYAKRYQLPFMVARCPSLLGPGQTGSLCAAWIRKIVQMERGSSPPVLSAYGLDEAKEFIDVRDACRAILFVLKQGEPGEVYELRAKQQTTYKKILHLLTSLSTIPFTIQETPSPIPFSSNQKTRRISSSPNLKRTSSAASLGWQPVFSLRKTLQDQLRWSRQTIP